MENVINVEVGQIKQRARKAYICNAARLARLLLLILLNVINNGALVFRGWLRAACSLNEAHRDK